MILTGEMYLLILAVSQIFMCIEITSAGGFYGPQGRILRIPLKETQLNEKLRDFKMDNYRITNFEMETAVIYGMSKLLGHQALSLNAIIANRPNGSFSKNPGLVIERLIQFTLDKITK